jgi:hypothetical protein
MGDWVTADCDEIIMQTCRIRARYEKSIDLDRATDDIEKLKDCVRKLEANVCILWQAAARQEFNKQEGNK